MFVFDLGSYGAWIALYSFLTVFGVVLMVRFYRTDWANIRLKEANGGLEEAVE
jgi:multidrug resistance protein, MATE family